MPIDPHASPPKYKSKVLQSPRKAEAVDISAGDHAFTVIPTTLYVGGAGNVYASLAGEGTTFHSYVGVTAGTTLIGQWHTIRSDTTATDMVALRPE